MSRRRYQKKADVASNTARETSRALQKEQRGMDRERRKLEAEEKKIIAKIKDCHKKNDLASAKIYARDLLRVRASAKRMLVMKSRIGSIAHRTKHMASTLKMTYVAYPLCLLSSIRSLLISVCVSRTAIQTASSAMSRINAAIDPQRFSAMMQQFAQQNDRMNVTEEMMDDMMGQFRTGAVIVKAQFAPNLFATLPSTDDFDQADEAEVDEITSSVLAEIGIELESKVRWSLSLQMLSAIPFLMFALLCSNVQLPAAKSGSMPALPQQQPQSLKTGDQATDALLAELGI